MLLILSPVKKLIKDDQVSERKVYAPLLGLRAVSLCFFILPPSEKLITEDELSENIAYASLFGLRAVILCFSLCLRAGSLL